MSRAALLLSLALLAGCAIAPQSRDGIASFLHFHAFTTLAVPGSHLAIL